MKTHNVAIIGCGVISTNHLYAIDKLDGLKLVAVCDIDEEKAKNTAEKYGVKYYTDYKKMAENEQLDGVHICLPHYLHKEVSIYFLEHKIPVLCEKPMALNLNECEEMINASQKNNTILDIIFQCRLSTASRLIFSTLQSGRLGKAKEIYAQVKWKRDNEYYNNGKWRGFLSQAGGGSLINQAIHTLDLARLIAGAEVENVSAQIANLNHSYIEVEDTVNAVITFENGAVLTFYSTNNNFESEPISIKVICEKGLIELTGGDATITLNDDTVLKNDKEDEFFCGVKEEYGTSHITQIHRFYFGNKDEIENNVAEALKTQKLIDKIYNR